jgi:hypothetical protein
MGRERIKGGFYLKARSIQESVMAHETPCCREVWDYLLREANYKPQKYSGFIIERGELFRTIKNIRDSLSWYIGYRRKTYSVKQVKDALERLRRYDMIVLKKEPRGLLIKIKNYDYYQDINSYLNSE